MKTTWMALLTILLLAVTVFGDSYTVQSGDTLSKIAQNKLGDSTRWKEIAELNNLKEPYSLSVGQKLELPESSPDTVIFRSVPSQEYNEPPSTTEKKPIDRSDLEELKQVLPLLFAAGPPSVFIILWYAVSLIISIFFLGVGYRFTASAINLKTTLRKCIIAAVSVTLSLLIPVGIILLACWSNPLIWPLPLLMVSPILLLLGYIFLAMYIIRTCLQCRWGLSFVVGFLGGIIGPAFHAACVYIIFVVILLFIAIISAVGMLF